MYLTLTLLFLHAVGDNHANLVKDMQDLDLGRVGGEGAGSADGMQADLPGHTLAHSQSFC